MYEGIVLTDCHVLYMEAGTSYFFNVLSYVIPGLDCREIMGCGLDIS
jgi:hypothetical protein